MKKKETELDDSVVSDDPLSEEIIAIHAIFEEDIEVVSPIDIKIKIRPRTVDSDYDDVYVLLSIQFSNGYPYTCPKLLIISEKGISKADVDKLMSLLHDRANLNVREGRVMIFDLVEAAQEFLSEVVVSLKQPQRLTAQNERNLVKNKETILGNSGISNKLLSEEVIAMRAIFPKDFDVVLESPTQIQIKIWHSEYEHVYVLLSMRFSRGYPYTCPKLRIISENGLSEADGDKLLSLLHDQANLNAREGCVMIYDLVEAVQEFLSEVVVSLKQSQVASDSERQSISSISCSRYLNDFEELRRLGRGGFGRVVLCKNKLDGRQYAVKKIPLKDTSEPLNDGHLREVTTLSGLQHQHVVRYYQAWVEVRDATSNSSYGDGASSSGSAYGSVDGSLYQSSVDVAGHLYIQMEYCPRTLEDVFTSYSNVDKKLAWRLFRQIVEGVEYIHGQGIIHRDLTPKNILLDARNDIKIGDFGLAKFLKLAEDNSEESGVSVTSDIGTHFYTPPEIQQHLPKINEKADIYSLGIVFLELWHPFSTGSERLVVLTKLRTERELPPDWVAEFPEQASLLSNMTSSSPSARPSASELLQQAFPPEFINNHQEPTQNLQILDHQILHFKVKKLSENAVLPTRGSSQAAGYDLSSAIETKVPARGKALVPTDLGIAVPEGTYARVAPRSGLAWKHSIDVGVGVIEADYRGPVGVILFNHSDVDFEVKAGDRIGQLVIEKIITSESIEVDDLDDICT